MILPFMVLQLLTGCDGVPPPAPITDVVIEPSPVSYAGPACLDGETCTTPADWDDREFLADGSARYTFTYVGELRAVELADGSWGSEEKVMINTGIPGVCWAWTWRPVQ
jgi:hypothetical protein